jgi:hypothetical protein
MMIWKCISHHLQSPSVNLSARGGNHIPREGPRMEIQFLLGEGGFVGLIYRDQQADLPGSCLSRRYIDDRWIQQELALLIFGYFYDVCS